MMSEPQPEYVWAFPPEKPKRGRAWLIVGLAVAAVLIAAVVVWLFLRPGAQGADLLPTTTASPSASPTTSATPTPTPSASVVPTTPPSAEPTAPAPPPVSAPDLEAFRDKVSPVLGDARRGLQIARESEPQEAAQTVGFLQEDAGRLAETVAPSSISSRWGDRLEQYARSLQTLRTAYERGGTADRELTAATEALAALESVVAGG